MRDHLNTLLKSKVINEWNLFFIISVPMSLIILMQMLSTDMSSGEGISHIIGYSVRFAIPLIFIVAAASSVQVLFPSPFGKWWLRNRKYLGLCFAVAMAWQGAFIFIISTFTRDYYFSEIYFFRDELEGTVGYIFLTGMIVTSFAFGRNKVDSKQWKLIQKGGLYFLWSYAFSVYWWNLYYYPYNGEFRMPLVHDYIFYWMGFAAVAIRIAAWGKKRLQRAQRKSPDLKVPALYSSIGGILIALGLLGSATGILWNKQVNAFMTAPSWSAEMVLWLPFWPLEPFMPHLIIGLGTLLATKVKA
jgi:hypothetical protein